MRAILLAAALLLAESGGVLAQGREIVSPRPEKTALVIYRDGPINTWSLRQRSGFYDEDEWDRDELTGLALVVETRAVDVPAGRSLVRFAGVAEGLIPQSARVEGLDGARERTYDFDLLSPATLIERAVGQAVKQVRTNPATGKETVERGVLRSGPAGVVIDFGARVEALGCSGGPERLVLDRLPPRLAEEPTLSVLVDSPRAARRTVRLSYLTAGLQWSADYVARVLPDGRTLSLQGWITLANNGRAGFEDAETYVVAGNLNRVRDGEAPEADGPAREARCWPMDTTTKGKNPPRPPAVMPLNVVDEAFADDASEVESVVVTGSRIRAKLGELGDYKLYTLPEPTTVAARQTKQVLFLEQERVAFQRRYYAVVESEGALDDDENPGGAAGIELRLVNTAEGGLGVPLPGGSVSVLERGPGGRALLVGQATPLDIPVGLPLELPVARSTEVTLEARVLDENDRRLSVEVTASNAKAESVTLDVWQTFYDEGGRVLSEDHPHALRRGSPVWTITVPANGRASLRYTVQRPD